ncbi:uncharacterized protein TNCV_3707831 [Trichonephila clavipes]|nr:uncharacterized protein TNCV_3707831 [Trichonephila clavipes]
MKKARGGGQVPPISLLLPPTWKDLPLDGYLKYPYAAKALYIYKHPCLLRDSNPAPTAPQSASLTAIPEDFGKRNMPGKRSRKHFSQLSEFERGLIIGMKTAGWSTRRVAGLVDRLECAVRNCWEQWT